MDQFFLFVFRSCLRGNDRCVEYYERLGVTKNATREDIRRAYRLKSLAMHPDKLAQRGQAVTPEIQAQFTSVKEAYEVLCDSKKRKTYDMVGESGMKIISGSTNGDPSILIKNIKSAPCYDKVLIISIILLIAAFPVIQPVLFCLKVDGDIDGSWKGIWTPMWILDIVQLLVVLAIVSEQPKHSEGPRRHEDNAEGAEDLPEGEPMSTFEIVTTLIDAIMFPISQILVILRLDGNTDYSWSTSFIPLYIWLANGIIVHVPHLFKSKQMPVATTMQVGMNEVEAGVLQQKEIEEFLEYLHVQVEKMNAKNTIIITIMQLVFVILLADKLDNGGITWAVVFSPLWAYFAYFPMRYFYYGSQAKHVDSTINKEEIMASTNENGEINVSPEIHYKLGLSTALRNEVGGSLFTFSLIVVVGSLTYVKSKGADFSTFIVFIPVFIIAGLFFLFICCTTCMVSASLALTPADELAQYAEFKASGNAGKNEETNHHSSTDGGSATVGYSTFDARQPEPSAIEVVKKESTPNNDHMAID